MKKWNISTQEMIDSHTVNGFKNKIDRLYFNGVSKSFFYTVKSWTPHELQVL